MLQIGVVFKYYLLLFDLILMSHQQSSDIKGRVFLGWTSSKLGLMCLAQGHYAVMPVRLEPATPRSPVKHFTTEPLRSLPSFKFWTKHMWVLPGCVAQSVTCLATDASLTADPGVASSITARSHTFVEIDHEIISTIILLPSAESFKKGCCQLQARVCARSTG